jgi:hypothetical protein
MACMRQDYQWVLRGCRKDQGHAHVLLPWHCRCCYVCTCGRGSDGRSGRAEAGAGASRLEELLQRERHWVRLRVGVLHMASRSVLVVLASVGLRSG